MLGAKFSLRLTIYFIREVLNSRVENTGYILDHNISKKEVKIILYSQVNSPTPVFFISIMRLDMKFRNIKTKGLDATILEF